MNPLLAFVLLDVSVCIFVFLIFFVTKEKYYYFVIVLDDMKICPESVLSILGIFLWTERLHCQLFSV